MTKGSPSYSIFLEVDLFHALPALYKVYTDGFMEYTYHVDHFK